MLYSPQTIGLTQQSNLLILQIGKLRWGGVTCPGAHNSEGAGRSFIPRVSDPKALALVYCAVNSLPTSSPPPTLTRFLVISNPSLSSGKTVDAKEIRFICNLSLLGEERGPFCRLSYL